MSKAAPTLARCQADASIERVVANEFKFPLGVYPVEPMEPKAGYAMFFEPADGAEEGSEPEGEWEEWPDRYVFDAVVPADRVEALCRTLFSMFRGRVYPILDVLGHDAYREIDPYISYELLGIDRFLDALRRFRDFCFEDGLCGFGAMSEEPFFYVFVDEHKIVTVRADPAMKDRIEKVLHAFDLEQIEDPAGADAAAHEHRGVLLTPDKRPDLLSFDEIVERLRDDWRLALNINPRTNVDEEGNELGVTLWRCEARCWNEDDKPARYAEVFLMAANLEEAEESAVTAVEALESGREAGWDEMAVIVSDRLLPEQLKDYGLGGGEAGEVAGGATGLRKGRGKAGKQGSSRKSAPETPPSEGLEEKVEGGRIIAARWIE